MAYLVIFFYHIGTQEHRRSEKRKLFFKNGKCLVIFVDQFSSMAKFIDAIKKLEIKTVENILADDPKWIHWQEADGKNALHYLCGVKVVDREDAATSLQILKLLLKKGMDINSIHRIPDQNCGFFPATPLWYAYTRGRNEKVFRYLLSKGADPNHCMFAIAWYDDVNAANLFKKHGADINELAGADTPFLGAFNWKRFNVARWFLQNGADVNAPDKDGNTALFYAVKKKYDIEQIEMLLKFGADINHNNNMNVSPKGLAEKNRQRKILQVFGV
jgi:ankyrin repeat protein